MAGMGENNAIASSATAARYHTHSHSPCISILIFWDTIFVRLYNSILTYEDQIVVANMIVH
jgi:hypothetical protein